MTNSIPLSASGALDLDKFPVGGIGIVSPIDLTLAGLQPEILRSAISALINTGAQKL